MELRQAGPWAGAGALHKDEETKVVGSVGQHGASWVACPFCRAKEPGRAGRGWLQGLMGPRSGPYQPLSSVGGEHLWKGEERGFPGFPEGL